jgi:hypothetical protein
MIKQLKKNPDQLPPLSWGAAVVAAEVGAGEAAGAAGAPGATGAVVGPTGAMGVCGARVIVGAAVGGSGAGGRVAGVCFIDISIIIASLGNTPTLLILSSMMPELGMTIEADVGDIKSIF